jgi:hypothetical protein
MVRTVSLSLLLLISIGVMIPFASSTAHGIRQSYESKHHRRHYRHSRAWWRRYHARLRRRRAAALAHRSAPLAPVFFNSAAISDTSAVRLPQLPLGWKSFITGNNAELRFRTETGNPAVPGQATLSVVALSRPNPAYLTSREQQRMLAGVACSDLRRIVIDKMVTSGGWVVNDYEREVTGRRVFVVTAQTPADGRSPEMFWNFYFTEFNGRIYNLTTNTPLESSDRMAVEAEKFIVSLYAAGSSSSQPSNR